ncbi:MULTISPECIES: MerR family transcriptional regulator [Kitasatospora]|uniref:Putative MerR family transcriptional regulator n=1 Tax=Kitasatospora setae (strain ATCC 33774 / DSM 43861 / JCM 3304 / KCC A-0304 / NBRC 14216 / KM-6054) TaxID=452652 RepID=E4NAS6_KITSK|nr:MULTISPECIES: MerR family transcriptional regulator [Kitasatospora]BAJ28307.1 putative MerR family transcriptional regulator [Kitasatospora setae KM-6054]
MAEAAEQVPACEEAFRHPVAVPDLTPRHSIGEVSAISGLSAHTLRWYERIGLLEPVDRSHAGQRRYTDADLARLAFLTKLRLTGMPVADMVRYVELLRAGDGTRAERRDLLVAHRTEVRQRLADLHATLAAIDKKIDHYDELDARLPDGGLPGGRTAGHPAAEHPTAEHPTAEHPAQDRKSA